VPYIIGNNFGLSVPTGATIDGIEIRVDVRCNRSGDKFVTAQAGKSVGNYGNNLANSEALSTNFTTFDFGSSTELWGFSLAPSDVNSSSFNASFNFVGTSFNSSYTFYVDAIWVKVYYTA
jgi:hypothetical protein